MYAPLNDPICQPPQSLEQEVESVMLERKKKGDYCYCYDEETRHYSIAAVTHRHIYVVIFPSEPELEYEGSTTETI